MSGIVCAIRGGPDSRGTIDKAIALSRQKGLALNFLYVIDLNFLNRTETSRTQLISKEMHEMGDFILSQAALEAQAQGIEVENIIRQGKVRDEIIKLCHELDANAVVLGQSRSDEETDLFTQDQLRKFSQQIQAETGAQVFLVKSGRSDEA